MREIGEGQFGKVLLMSTKVCSNCMHTCIASYYQEICDVTGPVLIAVKTLTSRKSKNIELFSKKLDLMKKFIHPNIVSLLGMCPHYMHDH